MFHLYLARVSPDHEFETALNLNHLTEGDDMRNILLNSALALGFLCAPTLAGQGSGRIRAAQQALKEKGYDPGPVDGVNGPKTREAVKSYQQKERLDADGRLGAKTLDSLGVKEPNSGKQFSSSGERIKNSYSEGGKKVGEGSKEMGHDVKRGEVAEGAKDFGKGVGSGARDIGVGTGKAAKSAAKGVKNALTPGKTEAKNPR
jgi:peptidoglycan hydrolase-like protein with peptidoglycan-binding domain